MAARLRRADPLVCALLALATLAVHGPAVHHDFLLSDDAKYSFGNDFVRAGLTRPGLVWAFTSGYASNWFPLTWLSLMLDSQLFGAGPSGYHTTNVALHVLGTLLLYAALRRLTGRVVPAALAALLHGIHPLHVESVAWIPQRKDVLAFAFGMAALFAYAGYARRETAGRYAAVAALLALGLMAKPMLVTLPLLLLLLDYWPLGRLRLAGASAPAGALPPAAARPLARLVVEKLPLLALAAASSWVTLRVQTPAMAPGDALALPVRLVNAVVAYGRYLAKLVWPRDLAIFYPHPALAGGEPWSVLGVLAAAALLVATSAAALAAARRQGFWIVGWLWFVGALVPMIGVVQVGTQGLADRYTYLPAVGLYVALAWGADAGLARIGDRPLWRALAVGACAAALGLLAVRGAQQVALFRNTRVLFEHARSVSPRAPFVLTTLGSAYFTEGRADDAVALYREALAEDPDDPVARSNLAVVLASRGALEPALRELELAVRANPRDPKLRLDAGKLFTALGQEDAALARYREVVALAPETAPGYEARELLARALLARGRSAEASPHLEAALAQRRGLVDLDPGSARARLGLARLLVDAGEAEEALVQAREAERLAPEDPAVLEVLARALALSGEPEQATLVARRALERAEQQGRARLVAQIRRQLERYEARALEGRSGS